MGIPSRDNWSFKTYNIKSILKDKDRLIKNFQLQTLLRTLRIFEYEGLPETIPQKDLEMILQVVGYATITEVEGKLYAFYGGLGGMLNEYYLPTLSVVANPYLKFTKVLSIGDNCEVVLSDSLYQGLTPIIDTWAELQADTLISLKFACINSRLPMIATTTDDEKAEALNTLFTDIENGKSIKAISVDNLINADDVATKNYFSNNQSTIIKELVELYQFIESKKWNDLGLQANFNMKRESLNENEIGMNLDVLIPLIDDMLYQRQLGFEKVNKHYNTNISVKLSKTWQKIKDLALEENDVEEVKKEVIEDEE